MTDDPVAQLVDTARAFHSWHRLLFGWWCPGCRLLDAIDEGARRYESMVGAMETAV